MALAKAGALDQAQTTFEEARYWASLLEGRKRDSVLRSLVRDLLKVGFVTEAMRVAADIKGEGLLVAALLEVAGALRAE